MKKTIILLTFIIPCWMFGQNIPLNRDLQIEYQLQHKEQLPLSTTAMSPWVLQVPDSIVRTLGSWLKRKIFNEHLVGINEGNLKLTLDPLINFQGGIDRISNKKTWTNTYGFIIKGKLGEKLTLESTFQENRASFTPYLDKFIQQYKIIPGSGRLLGYNGGNIYDYSMVTAYLDYTPNKHFDYQLGNGKNFIGEGYRSLFLSDESYAYPYLRITTSFWHIKYTNLYTQFTDLRKDVIDTNNYRKKYSAIHLLSWDITKNFNFTFFEAVVWNAGDSMKRGFDVSYLNPIIFYRPVEFGLGSPDNELMGFMSSYRLNRTTLYGQLMLDEFRLKDVLAGKGMWANKQAYQIGVKSFEPFNIRGLYVLAEFNHARPFTYSHDNVITNWGNYNQPLADPLGANFKEGVIQIRYQRDRWIGNITIVSAIYGLDMNNKNYGKDIYLPYKTALQFYGNVTGQGLHTTLFYFESELRYVINKAMHLEAVGRMLYRNEKNNQWTQKDNEVTIGLRTNVFSRYGAF